MARKDSKMETNSTVFRGRFAAALGAITLASALLLTACGGGGSGTTPPPPPPTSVTVTCPDSSQQTGTTAENAALKCADGKLSSITPADKATGVNIDSGTTFKIDVATNSAIMVPNVADVSLKAGQTNVPGTITLVGTKGFTFTPTAKLLYGQLYNFVASVKDGLGRIIAVNSSFTTASVSCTAPQVPATDGQSCVTPITLHYTDKVLAIWEGSQLFSVDKVTGANLLTNKTPWQQVGGYPLYNCWLPTSGPLADGRILTTCQDAITKHRHYLYIDPLKNEVYEYKDQVPAKLTCTENADFSWTCPANNEWIEAQATTPPGSPTDTGIGVQVADGWYFNTNKFLEKIFFHETVTNVTTEIPGYKTGAGVKLFMAFSH